MRLLLDALGDAIIFREGRGRALDRAARKSLGRPSEASLDDQERRRKYQALLQKLSVKPSEI
jgi:hypothetical protein